MGKPARATIQINGRTYDALSGQLVSQPAPAKTAAPAKTKSVPHSKGHSIEGVVRAKPAHHRPAAKQVHARTKRAHTLNRSAVHKAGPAASKPAPSAPIDSGNHTIDVQRAQRAKRVHKSRAISKFGSGKDAPATTATTIVEPPAPTPIAPPAAPLSAKEELIAQHLAQVAATSSAQPKPKRGHRVKQWLKQPRRSTVLATTASAVLLAGYITYINIPNMALRVASSRAGFAAHLPGYQPAGFSFSGPVAYQPGEITVSYDSTGGGRSYTIVQKESNWDSQTLLDHIEPQAELYPATYQESGLTVYVYDSKVATWVNAGVWYTINNDQAQLTTEQMLKIAASL